MELARGGQTPEDLARKFEPSANAIRNWVVQAARDEGRRTDGLTTDEKEELRRLRREVRLLREAPEILRQAAAKKAGFRSGTNSACGARNRHRSSTDGSIAWAKEAEEITPLDLRRRAYVRSKYAILMLDLAA